MDFTVTLVGAGNMGGAMLKGWLAQGLPASNVSVVDPAPSQEMADYLSKKGIGHFASADNAQPSDVLILAVKPQLLDAVLPLSTSLVGENTTVVSVAAGKTLSYFESHLGDAAIIRSMPNTPALIGRGMTVAVSNRRATEAQKENVTQLLSAIGSMAWVDDEHLIDAVTAVSGSGPAYVFHLAECMAQAGEKAGLPAELAARLAIETIAGAGELMRSSDQPPSKLRENVTSPGGTTAAALEVLMGEGAMPDLLERAIMAAKKRSEELS